MKTMAILALLVILAVACTNETKSRDENACGLYHQAKEQPVHSDSYNSMMVAASNAAAVGGVLQHNLLLQAYEYNQNLIGINDSIIESLCNGFTSDAPYTGGG